MMMKHSHEASDSGKQYGMILMYPWLQTSINIGIHSNVQLKFCSGKGVHVGLLLRSGTQTFLCKLSVVSCSQHVNYVYVHNGFVASYTEALKVRRCLLANTTLSRNLGDPPAYAHARNHDDDPATPPAPQLPPAYTRTHGPNDSPTTHTCTPATPPTYTLTPDLHDLSPSGNQPLQNSQTTPTAFHTYGDHLPSYQPTQDEPSGYGQLDDSAVSALHMVSQVIKCLLKLMLKC